ncbi:hypothetical protein GCM10010129_72900 [Streptomyces fumigatiscleroticus]|nr:hypothetical protein GCM10010129_72900 [Streptomyces fumigatiscleroticus]
MSAFGANTAMPPRRGRLAPARSATAGAPAAALVRAAVALLAAPAAQVAPLLGDGTGWESGRADHGVVTVKGCNADPATPPLRAGPARPA